MQNNYFREIKNNKFKITLLKKAGLELIYSNYRPVSNLSFLSKLIEKCALYKTE